MCFKKKHITNHKGGAVAVHPVQRMMKMNDRNYYRTRPTVDLKGRFRNCMSRLSRADTMEAATTDMFIQQEITAVLQERGDFEALVS